MRLGLDAGYDKDSFLTHFNNYNTTQQAALKKPLVITHRNHTQKSYTREKAGEKAREREGRKKEREKERENQREREKERESERTRERERKREKAREKERMR